MPTDQNQNINNPVSANPTPMAPVATPTPSPAPTPAPATPPVPTGTPAPTVSMNENPGDESEKENDDEAAEKSNSIMADVAAKINDAHNILIALSSDPTVDELSAAIGLSLCLDRTGKRATAIYSGATPNALEFLKPDETFESSADTLQDFVIAINKDKADHLRYKLDGDYVKIFITPYKTRIDEEDLEFSYGDFNIDLVLALDVANGVDLDSALREHGRIMHDAVIINMTTGNPGKFGEIEWSDLKASSVSEMSARLLYSMERKLTVESDEATAFLTGIIAATNRFSNATTTPETLQMASRLMESGADQQLVVENISSDVDNELFNFTNNPKKLGSNDDSASLDIEHDEEEGKEEALNSAAESESKEKPSKASEKTIKPEEKTETPKATETTETKAEESPADAELKAIEDSLKETPPSSFPTTADLTSEPEMTSGKTQAPASPLEKTEPTPEKVLKPSSDFLSEAAGEGTKYSQMLEDALNEDKTETPTVTPDMAAPGLGDNNPLNLGDNPAASLAPNVAEKPEINGVPEINYMPLPGDEVLPPPPAPPIADTSALPPTPAAESATPSTPAAPSLEPTPSLPTTDSAPEKPEVAQPAMQDQVYNPQAADPSAFKIPGTV